MREVSGVFYLIGGLVMALIAVYIGADILTDSITEPQTQTIAGTTTATDHTLTSKHWYLPEVSDSDDTRYTNNLPDELTVANSGSAAGCSIAAPNSSNSAFGTPASPWNRTTVNVIATTAGPCIVTYLTETDDDVYNILVKMGPFVILIVGMLSAGVGTYSAGRTAREGGTIGRGVVAIAILLFGIILIAVVDTVADLARAEYATQPEYIAVGIVFTFVKVIYLASLAGAAFGSFGNRLPGIGSSM